MRGKVVVPASAGGLTTTTLVVLILSVAAATCRYRAGAFGRPIAVALLRRACALAVFHVALIAAATLLLCLSEPYPFQKVLFEALSAASTTGLSLGITPDLTGFGRVVIIATMFLGRVGPLALLGAVIFSHDLL